GDLMCILAGVAITIFYVLTRAARAAMPLATFMGITFAIGAASVAPLVWLAGVPVASYPAASWGWLAAMVVITTVAGPGLLNLAPRHVNIFTLNIVIVLEPAIAILLGAILFGATVTPLVVVGGAFLVASVVAGLRTV